MGTLATESYIRLVNRATHAHCDQDYLDYIVFNDSSVPDRTAYILGESDENPFPVLADDIEKATAMGASFIVLTCNTAHYFYDDFQALTTVPILQMPRGAVARMAQRYPKNRFPRVGFLGTVGSRKSGVYKRAVEEAGYTFVEPTDELQARITSLIYDDVKGSGELNLERYESVLRDMLDPAGPCACDTLILGCTHYPLLKKMIGDFMGDEVHLVDSGKVTAQAAAAALDDLGLLNGKKAGGTARYFVSDTPDNFDELAHTFLGEYAGGTVERIAIETY